MSGFCSLVQDPSHFLAPPCSVNYRLEIIYAFAAPWNMGRRTCGTLENGCVLSTSPGYDQKEIWLLGTSANLSASHPAHVILRPYLLSIQPILLSGLWWVLENKFLKRVRLVVKIPSTPAASLGTLIFHKEIKAIRDVCHRSKKL